MNLIDCVVTKVLTKPVFRHHKGVSWWAVNVNYESYGRETTGSTLSFKTQAEAEQVKVGYVFLA